MDYSCFQHKFRTCVKIDPRFKEFNSKVCYKVQQLPFSIVLILYSTIQKTNAHVFRKSCSNTFQFQSCGKKSIRLAVAILIANGSGPGNERGLNSFSLLSSETIFVCCRFQAIAKQRLIQDYELKLDRIYKKSQQTRQQCQTNNINKPQQKNHAITSDIQKLDDVEEGAKSESGVIKTKVGPMVFHLSHSIYKKKFSR